EGAGRPVVGSEQLAALEAIDRSHSISAAARRIGISYRRAWELVQGMNQAAGEPLVTTATGGVHGGGARLTPLGRWAMAGFRALQGNLPQTAASLVPPLGERTTPAPHVVAAVTPPERPGPPLPDSAAATPVLRRA